MENTTTTITAVTLDDWRADLNATLLLIVDILLVRQEAYPGEVERVIKVPNYIWFVITVIFVVLISRELNALIVAFRRDPKLFILNLIIVACILACFFAYLYYFPVQRPTITGIFDV